MSIEYTIDIQLTELGFPEIVPRNSSGRETSSRSISASQKQKVQHADAAKEASKDTAVRCKPCKSAQDEQVKGKTGESTAGTVNTTAPATGQGGDGGDAEVEDDSDDSEVSDACEEEEIDDDEEGLSSVDSSHPWEYRCSVCDLQLPSQFKLQEHMNLHTGARPYCCAECGKRFCQIDNYRVHLRTHAEAKVDQLMCRVCRTGFTSQEDLDEHLSSTHFEKEFYECDLCKHVFTSLKACENHVQLHTYSPCVKCETCGRSFPSTQDLLRHQKKCRRLFKCTDCSLTFAKKTALLKHSFSHLGLLPYTCLRCHCHFRLAQLYRRHKCEPGRIHCVACLREFLCQGEFEQHKKDTGCWGNQEPKTDEIKCLECGERFDKKEELKKHAGAHQRVLKCAECGKGFRSALLLMSHMGGHAGKSPCLCQSCGLGFPHQQNYESHLKTCGQTPLATRAPKKRPAEKNLSPLTKLTRSDSPNVTKAATPPAASTNTTTSESSSTSTATANASRHSITTDGPGSVPERAPPDSGPTDALQLLSLNQDQPSGVNLLLFLPVCPRQSGGLPLSAMEVQPGMTTPFKIPLLAPFNFVTKVEHDQVGDAPLDLSMKCRAASPAPSNTPPQSVKSEPAALEPRGDSGESQASLVSGEVGSAQTETCTEESV
ncbi:histone-lysine N-methyltransferase PRDM9 isoform X1 [Takifugu rubripes]|uniref:histone-lysine N-methyltransferase PRDM9 isoform X1 n=1 Tax=Takifugu rubripes TaxID=31033 RepID=UPI001146025C|nr:histone-lysine N-methyltransferase PRDM9-like isoform X1 [Takifugu rubripes]XP_029695242.1 histone-lysine N-methyltransferase PRDM9-like isoform X1 [Takifugu rubripes]